MYTVTKFYKNNLFIAAESTEVYQGNGAHMSLYADDQFVYVAGGEAVAKYDAESLDFIGNTNAYSDFNLPMSASVVADSDFIYVGGRFQRFPGSTGWEGDVKKYQNGQSDESIVGLKIVASNQPTTNLNLDIRVVK
jgi:hypothetical protein